MTAGGVMIGLYLPEQTSLAAWYTGVVLLLFAMVGRLLSQPLPKAA